jgi:hypothetical protein
MPHRADVGQVHLADELCAKRRGARRVERVPLVEVSLDQFGASLRAQIEDRVVSRIDTVRADRHDDVPMAGENARHVVVALEARNGDVTSRARPF